MDKNNIIGFALIAAVLIGFGIWNQPSAEEQAAAKGTKQAIEEAKAKLEAGTLHVFDTKTFTEKGKEVTSYMADVDTDADYTPDTEVVKDGYFHESEYRSAPYFNLGIDGITTLNQKF